VREDAFQVRRELAGAVLSEADGDLDRFLEDRAGRLSRLRAFLRSLSREGDPDLAGLTLAVRQLRSIVD
jgi:glutamate dehydrogenase